MQMARVQIMDSFMHHLIMQGILEFGITELNDNTSQPQRGHNYCNALSLSRLATPQM